MKLVVVGSVALDSVETPSGRHDDILGGSATYFSVYAGFFTPVNLVAVVGKDFPEEHLQFLKSRKINLDGLTVADGKTFRWSGKYLKGNLNEAITLDTQLNVFATFKPVIPKTFLDADLLFLANIDPEIQLNVLSQMQNVKFCACDTMNLWIQIKKEQLTKLIQKVDLLFLNDGEARQLSGEHNIVKAARGIQSMGAKRICIKRGEYGALLFQDSDVFHVPAYSLEEIEDPTGAGDTFAGGFMGTLARIGDLTPQTFRQALVQGSVMASFNVERFSLDRLKTLQESEILERFAAFKRMTQF